MLSVRTSPTIVGRNALRRAGPAPLLTGEGGRSTKGGKMSLSRKRELVLVAKEVSRDLRRRSTKAEGLLWQKLRDRRFLGKKFRRQHPLFHDLLGKETFYVADFYCHEMKLVVELDGGIHQKQRMQDELRSFVISGLGLTV